MILYINQLKDIFYYDMCLKIYFFFFFFCWKTVKINKFFQPVLGHKIDIRIVIAPKIDLKPGQPRQIYFFSSAAYFLFVDIYTIRYTPLQLVLLASVKGC